MAKQDESANVFLYFLLIANFMADLIVPGHDVTVCAGVLELLSSTVRTLVFYRLEGSAVRDSQYEMSTLQTHQEVH